MDKDIRTENQVMKETRGPGDQRCHIQIRIYSLIDLNIQNALTALESLYESCASFRKYQCIQCGHGTPLLPSRRSPLRRASLPSKSEGTVVDAL